MYQALYRSFRPEVFSELAGQEHIVRILQNQIKSGTTGHAYIFCGTRGTGKTTTARLLAKALNCEAPEGERPCGQCASCRAIAAGNYLDVTELDAASNNSVEDIRNLRESVNYPPAMGRKKVYILDEAHMLSTQAANALLKTLEEPPEHVVFILATTEPEKLPATILSRCLRLDFKRVPEEQLFAKFKEICEKIGVKAEDDALRLIVGNADGSVRDGLSLLDRCVSGVKALSREDVLFLLGMTGTEGCLKITDAVITKNAGQALMLLNSLLQQGKEIHQFTRDFLDHLRNLLIIKFVEHPEEVLNLSIENINRLKEQSLNIDITQLDRMIRILSEAMQTAKWSPRPRIPVEMALVEMASDFTASPIPDNKLPKASVVNDNGPFVTANSVQSGEIINRSKAGSQEIPSENAGSQEIFSENAYSQEIPSENAGSQENAAAEVIQPDGNISEGEQISLAAHLSDAMKALGF